MLGKWQRGRCGREKNGRGGQGAGRERATAVTLAFILREEGAWEDFEQRRDVGWARPSGEAGILDRPGKKSQ